jgi:hypothetical protein
MAESVKLLENLYDKRKREGADSKELDEIAARLHAAAEAEKEEKEEDDPDELESCNLRLRPETKQMIREYAKTNHLSISQAAEKMMTEHAGRSSGDNPHSKEEKLHHLLASHAHAKNSGLTEYANRISDAINQVLSEMGLAEHKESDSEKAKRGKEEKRKYSKMY